MSRKGQAQATGTRSTNADDYQCVPRALAAMPKDFAPGSEILPHRHERAQLIHATAGTMRVATDDSVWVVPPQRALWMPAGVTHSIAMLGEVRMRTLYLRNDAAAFMPRECRVLPVSGLLRELIVRATELPLHYDEAGPAGHVVALILAELSGLQSLPLQLPMPRDARLRAICQALLETPGDARPLEAWAGTANLSTRTLARQFQSQTGLSFGAWRQQARVLEAMGRLGSGEPVTRVALELGYESVSAFSAMFRRAAGTAPSRYRSRPSIGDKPFVA
ncbi:AraC-type DNA-binding protein [Enhydrobacter aerosaccus]|uniref:AraC-type DNA-binding protein n=1 Tax=Enhydrobacter aerosaccus TaxID=225324 RepID=A0A1T4K222_9HYPH|nr:helix-turn-helix transcriptional regulator [Enhydrobacter aerosaccus]SJZ36418.1 AraC-type DNA-binding protein [Enhydrobacter aerosaccus]